MKSPDSVKLIQQLIPCRERASGDMNVNTYAYALARVSAQEVHMHLNSGHVSKSMRDQGVEQGTCKQNPYNWKSHYQQPVLFTSRLYSLLLPNAACSRVFTACCFFLSD